MQTLQASLDLVVAVRQNGSFFFFFYYYFLLFFMTAAKITDYSHLVLGATIQFPLLCAIVWKHSFLKSKHNFQLPNWTFLAIWRYLKLISCKMWSAFAVRFLKMTVSSMQAAEIDSVLQRELSYWEPWLLLRHVMAWGLLTVGCKRNDLKTWTHTRRHLLHLQPEQNNWNDGYFSLFCM